jgi:DivIVA domain-containing protein
MPLSPADVRNKRFGVTRFRGGYTEHEVDSFLDAIEASLDRMIRDNQELRAELAAAMRGGIPRVPAPPGSAPGPAGQAPALVTAADVRAKRFKVTRLQHGYVDEEVDEFLAEAEAELQRLDQENAGLRARLAEFSRSWEQDPARFSATVDRLGDAPGAGPGYSAGPGHSAVPWYPEGHGADPVPAPERPAPPRRYWMEADMPSLVPLYAEVGLSIRICGDHRGPAASRSRGTTVTLIAHTRFELAGTSPLQQSVLVPDAGGSSAPARFTFHAACPGQYAIRVSAFAGGTFLGDLTADLSVERSGRLSRGPARTAELAEPRPTPGEVTLHVRGDGAQYVFQFLAGPRPMEPVAAPALTARPAEPRQRMAAAVREGYADGDPRAALERAGAGLWLDMVPDRVKEQFWQLRDGITSLSVLSDQDLMCWEVLYPLTRGEGAGFLAEQFPVLRRVAGQRPLRRISLEQPLYVAPPGAGGAGAEITALQRGLGPGAGSVDDMDRLLDLIDAGDFGLLHFACHDTFRPDPAGSSVALGGGRLIPAFLNPAAVSGSLAARRPLVFLNSSRSPGQRPEYTGLGGWAGQFMAAGAAAFIGAAWPVRPASALAFAEACYEAVRQGSPLAAAVAAARHAAAADAAEPAWLAYSAYGDPAAAMTAARGPAGDTFPA